MDSDQINKTFMKSSPPYLVEFDHELGAMFFALGNCLFVLKGTQCLNIMTMNEKEIDSKLIFVQEFEKAVNYLKISRRNLYVVSYSQQIYVYDIDNFLTNTNQIKANLNVPLQVFDLQNYFKDKTNGFIRQISTDKAYLKSQKFLITTSEQTLIEYIPNKGLQIFPLKVRSAIYNYTGQYIVCLPNLENEDQDHIFIYDTNNCNQYKELKPANKIKLSFPEEVKRDYYRTYFLTEYSSKEESKLQTTFIYSAFFQSDDDKASNIGSCIVFSIQEDLNPMISLQQLKERKRIQFYFDTDLCHQNDEDENSQIPIIRSLWLKDPLAQQRQSLCVLLINHSIQPFIFISLPDGQLKQCDYQKQNNIPKITRPPPIGEVQGEMDAQDCLGACLGGFIMQTCIDSKFPGNGPQIFQLFDDREDQFWEPPLITIYSLNGDFLTWQIFFKEYENRTCFLPITEAIISQQDQKKNEIQVLKKQVSIGEEIETQPQDSFTGNYFQDLKKDSNQIIQNVKEENKFQEFSFAHNQKDDKCEEKITLSEQYPLKNIKERDEYEQKDLKFQSKIQIQNNFKKNLAENKNPKQELQNLHEREFQNWLYDKNPQQKIQQEPNQKLSSQQLQQQKEEKEKEKQKQKQKEIEFLNKLAEEIEKRKQENLIKEEQLKQIEDENELIIKQQNLQILKNKDEEKKLKECKDKESIESNKLTELVQEHNKEIENERNATVAEKQLRLKDFMRQTDIVEENFNSLPNECKQQYFQNFEIYRENYQNLKVQQIIDQTELEKKLQQEITKKQLRDQYIDQLFLNKLDPKNAQVIQELKDLDYDDLPLFQLCILKQDEFLTQKYNEEIVTPLLYFKRQLVIDFQQLPIIDLDLVNREQQINVEADLENIKQVVNNSQLNIAKLSKLFKLIKDNLAQGASSKEKEFLVDQNLNSFDDSYEYMDYLIEQLAKPEIGFTNQLNQSSKLLSDEQQEVLQQLTERLKNFKQNQNKVNQEAKQLAMIPQEIENQLMQFSQTPDYFINNLESIENYLLKAQQVKTQAQEIKQFNADRGTFIFNSNYKKYDYKEVQKIEEDLNSLFKPMTKEESQLFQFAKEFLELIFSIEIQFTSEILQNLQKKVNQVQTKFQQPKRFGTFQNLILQSQPSTQQEQVSRSNNRAYGLIDEDLEDDENSTCDSQLIQPQSSRAVGRFSLKERIAQGFKTKKDQIVIRTEQKFKINEQDQNNQLNDLMNNFREKTLEEILKDKNQVNNIVSPKIDPNWIQQQKEITDKEIFDLKQVQIQKSKFVIAQPSQEDNQLQKQDISSRFSQLNQKTEEVKQFINQNAKISQQNSSQIQIEEQKQQKLQKTQSAIISGNKFHQQEQPQIINQKIVKPVIQTSPPLQPSATPQFLKQEPSIPQAIIQREEISKQKQAPSQQNEVKQNITQQTTEQEKGIQGNEQSNLFKKDIQSKVNQEHQQANSAVTSFPSGASLSGLGNNQTVPQFQNLFGSLNFNSERTNFEAPKLTKENTFNQQVTKVFGQNLKPDAIVNQNTKIQNTFELPNQQKPQTSQSLIQQSKQPQNNTFGFQLSNQNYQFTNQQNNGQPQTQQNSASPFASGSNFGSNFGQTFGNTNLGTNQNMQFQSQFQNPDYDPFAQNSSAPLGFNSGLQVFPSFDSNINKSQIQNFGKARK